MSGYHDGSGEMCSSFGESINKFNYEFAFLLVPELSF